MSRILTMILAMIAYAIFFATFLYLIIFVGDFSFATITVDEGPQAPIATAVVIDLALIALFGVQHSVMARQGFKRWWTRVIPPSAERSVYVLMASAALIVLMTSWRPIDAVVWNVTSPLLYDLIWVAFWAGWATVLLSTFLINHFELFGLQQAWLHVRGREPAPPSFRTPLFYRWVRHPLYLGFFIAFWATPEMTAGHLLLASGVSLFMLIAIQYEERDLVGYFGRDYEEYREKVGMLIPGVGRRKRTPG
jgi:protein-S-isoprenylcysteine O-methyltransferase Ste14